MFDFSYLAEPLAAQPMFGIALTLFAYAFGVWLSRRVKTPLVNPMLVALVLVIAVLLLFRIPYASYESGGAVTARLRRVTVPPVRSFVPFWHAPTDIMQTIISQRRFPLPILTAAAGRFLISLSVMKTAISTAMRTARSAPMTM